MHSGFLKIILLLEQNKTTIKGNVPFDKKSKNTVASCTTFKFEG